MPQLSDSSVRKLATPQSGYSITWDGLVKGFGVRVTANGARSFVLDYRVRGRKRRMTIGSFLDWGVATARDHARRLKREIDTGADPLGDVQSERDAETMADLADLYETHHLPLKRPSSQYDDRVMLRDYVRPRLGGLKVAEVRHSDVVKLHREVSRKGPYRANRVLALLSKMFELAIKWDQRTDNPCKGVERNHEERRERHLNTDELTRLVKALADHPNQQSANAIRMLLLTGARRGEVLTATWDQFDLESGVWTKPSAHTKQKKEHRVPLSAVALQLLSGMNAGSKSEYLFPGKVAGEPQKDIKYFWRGVCKSAGLVVAVGEETNRQGETVAIQKPSVRIHDLRHTYASLLASSGYSLPVIGALLGHTQAETTNRYAHLLDGPLRDATNVVGGIVMPDRNSKTGEVVLMKPVARRGPK